MHRIVISQPMLFPWIGIFEQIRLADTFVHYDDVQMPQGRSYMSRVQLKSPDGIVWLTVPVLRQGKQLIRDVRVDDSQPWRSQHIKTLRHLYGKAPFVDEMLAIVESVYSINTTFLAELNTIGIETIARYFGLERTFKISSTFATSSHSSEKLLDLVTILAGKVYITGHGAKNYLNHELFEEKGISVEYMDYQRTPYLQLHGEFNPHVSILDVIANLGRDGIGIIASATLSWKEFTACQQ